MKQEKDKKPAKKLKRKDNPFAALDPKLNLKSRYNEIEDLASYANTLPLEAKQWLNAYAEEEIIGNRYHKGQKLNDFEDPKTRSRIYNRNNARNRCILTREEAQGTLNYLYELEKDEDDEANGETYDEKYT